MIHTLLSRHRFSLSCEKELQAEISCILDSHGIAHEREVRLAEGDVIDFMVGHVGMEVKIKGNADAIYKQCRRYCASAVVQEFMLVTNRSMGLPRDIDGKPCYILNLGKGWM